MKDLFKAELLRFRLWAIAALVVHLMVLAFLARLVDLAQQPLLVYRVFGGVYAIAGLLLGMYQMGSYRKPGAWLNLLHRPLAPRRIATALLGAGALSLAFAVAVPILVIALYQATMTARVVDVRHWLIPLAAVLITLCCYLAGVVAVLGNRRWSTCGLVLPVLLAVAQASGWAALAVQGLALVWLMLLVGVVFKPDLGEPPRTLRGTVLTAVPIQMGAYLLILLLGLGIEMLWIAQGTHPNNMATPPHGGHNETERMTGQQRMLAGLAASHDPNAPLWREQVGLSKVYGINGQMPWRLERGALTNHRPMEFDDARRRVDWVFSDDRMRFEGYGIADGRRVGEMGVTPGDTPFPAPAMAVGAWPGPAEGDAELIAGNSLYHYVSETGRVLPRVVLPADELVLGTQMTGETLLVNSDRAVYFFDGRAVMQNEAVLKPRERLPIPGRYGDLRNIDLIELVDGYLVSFGFYDNASNLLGVPPYQDVVWLHDDGSHQIVARRKIRFDYPAVYRYKAWWPSPAVYTLRVAAIGLFAMPNPLDATSPPPVPRSMLVLAGVLMLLSLLGAVWLVRRRALSQTAGIVWVLACGAIGVPALVSLWLLYPVRDDFGAAAAT